jgi:hypothetical protein
MMTYEQLQYIFDCGHYFIHSSNSFVRDTFTLLNSLQKMPQALFPYYGAGTYVATDKHDLAMIWAVIEGPVLRVTNLEDIPYCLNDLE